MRRSASLILSVAALLASSLADIRIYGPTALKDEFKANDYVIKSSVSNFGNIPYGQKILGRLYYNEENADGCNENKFITVDFTNDPDELITPIFLVNRGGCTFVTKVRNLETMGAAVVLIADNKAEDVNNIIMSDDSTGTGIRIPAMLIGKRDGKDLMNWFKQASPEQQKAAALAIEFESLKTADLVEWQYWFSSSDDRALDFFRDFEATDLRLQSNQYAKFTPHWVSYSFDYCDSKMKDDSCISYGKYCALDHQGTKILGRDIMMENLRERCIWELVEQKELSQRAFWDYMRVVHQLCYTTVNEDCSKNAVKDLQYSQEKIDNCVKNSFDKPGDASSDNRFMKEELAGWKQQQSGYWPLAVVNNEQYRGTINERNLRTAICQALTESYRDACNDVQIGVFSSEKITGTHLIMIVVGLLVINLLILAAFRFWQKKRERGDLQLQVHSAVSNYFAISERK